MIDSWRLIDAPAHLVGITLAAWVVSGMTLCHFARIRAGVARREATAAAVSDK